MTDILLTNDDGFRSPGFYPLLKELSQDFSVTAVAPQSEQSWISKSISRTGSLTLKREKLQEFEVLTLNGTPADCVQIGLYDVLAEKPRLVVSGVNIGLNTGHGRILSSGTVGASMEASIDGVKSIAASFYIPGPMEEVDPSGQQCASGFQNAAQITKQIIKMFIAEQLDAEVDLLSINIPFEAKPGAAIEVTRPHREAYGQLFHKDQKNQNVFKHSSPPIDFSQAKPGTDLKALAEGKVSLTPISLDLVSEKSMEQVRRRLEESS